jgi:hypothetical protein
MSTLDEPFSGLLVDASHGHGKRGGQHEASCFILTKVDPGDDVDIVIGKAVTGIPAHMKECILKAGCIPAGEELFGIGRIAPTAKRPRQCELEVEQTVFAADRTVTASAAVTFVEYRLAIAHMPSSLRFDNFETGRPDFAATHQRTARA